MTEKTFDVVIVGARCAGAALATHLGRRGMRVCVVEADKLPSDQPFSTHAILPLGIDYLKELGVAARVGEVSTLIRTNRLSVGHATVQFTLPPSREMYCPRRSTLDPLLAEAAAKAGAEIRDETAVLDVLRDGDRVVGVRARHGSLTTDIHARLVVGADGRNSTIAKCVRAEAYHPGEAARGGYWAYFPVSRAVAALPFQTYIEIRGDDARFFFRTDGDLVLAGALAPTAVVRTWTRDIAGSACASLRRSEITEALFDGGAAPVGRFVGLRGLKTFFRVPVGPGWALVGDAGLHKDPTPGYGITDALRDAKHLSTAILDGREAALEVYWRRRDVQSIALYMNAAAMGSLDYDNPFNEIVLSKIGSTPSFEPRLHRVIDRDLSPFETAPTWRIFAWALEALARGRTEILKPFLAGGKRGQWVQDETAKRQVLLEVAERRLAGEGRRTAAE